MTAIADRPSLARLGASGVDRPTPKPGGDPRRRLKVMIAVWIAIGVVFAAQLVRVQALDSERLVARGQEQRQSQTPIAAPRGAIVDRSGENLSVSTNRPTLFLDPQLVDDEVALADAVSPILGLDRTDLIVRLRDLRANEKRFMYLARQIDEPVAKAVMALGHPSIGSIPEPFRFRPAGQTVASSLLGSVDIDHVGVSGIELLMDEQLTGTAGELVAERSVDGTVIPTGHIELRSAEPGADVMLTIDRDLQWLTEDVLRSIVDAYDAESAVAVVLDVDTAEILAMASVDGGEGPARSASYNMAAVDVIEPGSISKVFPIAAAIEEGLTVPHETLSVPTSLQIYDVEIGDDHAVETRDLTTSEIIQRSSNVGTVLLTERLGPTTFDAYLRQFGFGSRSGAAGTSQFPGESAGQLMPVSDWNAATLPTVSYGQGIGVTALQMAGAYNTIANDGRYRTPSLVRGTVDGDAVITPQSSVVERSVVSPETAQTMRTMMSGVVDGRGTGSRAAIPGYDVAGKTGTARKPDFDNGGYRDDAWIATFAGFAPADDPAVTVVVFVDDPKPEYYGGVVAAPAFQQIAEYALRMLRVAPSQPVVSSDGEPVLTASTED